jgi:hypothetical protein
MQKEDDPHRFGPECWVTMRDTGEHVKIESWSRIAAAYRIRSRKNGLQLVSADALIAIDAHPEAHLNRHWSRCQATGCGAPLTPELPTCPQCNGPTCTCGGCQCVPTRARAKTARKKAAPTVL